MNIDKLYSKAIEAEDLNVEEALYLYENAPFSELMYVADSIRKNKHSDNIVTWQIDRNVNITNVCISGCKFCNFHCRLSENDKIFVTSLEQYAQKIEQTISLGGDQLLLQGGLHPKLDLNYYKTLFKELKKMFPTIKLHALGPPEIAHIARISGVSTMNVLEELIDSGLDSLPGAGAEILDEQVRKIISPGKPSAKEWLDVMGEAHKLNLATSATMMYGHIETKKQRIEHIIKIRDLQKEVPSGNYGFIAFVPWIFRSSGTQLEKMGVQTNFSSTEYIRIIAISRIILNNINNIQTSWLTVGKDTAQITLHAGANDMGSIMIEENVVSSAGANNKFDAQSIQLAIKEAGFTPRLRDQKYNYR